MIGTPLHCTLRRSRRRLARLACIAGLLCAGVPSHAQLTISVQSVAAAPGSTGNSLDVLLTNSGAAPQSVSAFSFELGSSTADIQFSLADTGTAAAPYIFAGDSAFGPVISTSAGQTVDASDLYDIPGSAAVVGAGATVGLGRVVFDVGGSAGSGAVDIVLAGFPSTSLSGADGGAGSDLPYLTAGGGSIIVTSPVPEPRTGLLALAGALVLTARARRRGRRAGRADGR